MSNGDDFTAWPDGWVAIVRSPTGCEHEIKTPYSFTVSDCIDGFKEHGLAGMDEDGIYELVAIVRADHYAALKGGK